MIAIRDLEVAFGGVVVARVPELDVGAGEIVGLAGESGAGKSMTALAIIGLARTLGADVQGSIRFNGRELVGLPERELRRLRGAHIAMVMQSPREALPPTLRLGTLFERVLRQHGVPKADAHTRTRRVVSEVSLQPDILELYPHQVSGGQAQRFAIALATSMGAELVIADEPTSALDALVQAEVLDLLRRLRDEHGTALVLISHDLAVIRQLADRVAVLRRGEIVESGLARRVLSMPEHAYTRELLAAVPVIGARRLA